MKRIIPVLVSMLFLLSTAAMSAGTEKENANKTQEVQVTNAQTVAPQTKVTKAPAETAKKKGHKKPKPKK